MAFGRKPPDGLMSIVMVDTLRRCFKQRIGLEPV